MSPVIVVAVVALAVLVFRRGSDEDVARDKRALWVRRIALILMGLSAAFWAFMGVGEMASGDFSGEGLFLQRNSSAPPRVYSGEGKTKMKHIILAVTLTGLLLAACGTPPTPAPTDTPLPPTQPAPTETHIPVDLSPAQRAAIQMLADSFGVSVDQIRLVSTEAVDWPDGCLGIQEPGMACTLAIVPGFRIVLEAQGRQYEYRTNQDGSIARPATVALTWQREGGIAGFCDDLIVYASGEAHAIGCKASDGIAADSLQTVLSEAEVNQFNEWLATFGTVTVRYEDPAVADQMKVTLRLYGVGNHQPTEAEQQEMITFAQTVYDRVKP